MGVMDMAISAAEKARSGTREWVFQRIANVSILLWGALFIGLILNMDSYDYNSWQALFAPLWFKIYSSLTLILISLNSVLAGWQIGTDYVKKATINRLYMLVCILGSLAYLGLGLYILWVLA